MPKLTTQVPRYTKHKSSGQARCQIDGKDFLLGPPSYAALFGIQHAGSSRATRGCHPAVAGSSPASPTFLSSERVALPIRHVVNLPTIDIQLVKLLWRFS